MHLLLWGPFENGASSTKSEGFDLAATRDAHRSVASVDVSDLAEKRLLCRRRMYQKCSALLPDADIHDSCYSPSSSTFISFRCH